MKKTKTKSIKNTSKVNIADIKNQITNKFFSIKNSRSSWTIPILVAIIIVYAALAFIRLGDTSAPQTFQTIDANNPLVIDLKSVRHVDRISTYFGVDTGKYYIYAANDAQSWISVPPYRLNRDITESVPLNSGSCFAWNAHDYDFDSRYIAIFPAAREKLSVGEIAIYSKGELLPISAVNGADNYATDEQNLAQDHATYMNGTYFDEVYHPRTSYEILHRLPVYENTHPPLGKLIISLGISAFGMTPFGWRFMGTLCGVLMLPVLFLLIKKLLNSDKFALFGTALFALDFMHFSLTRMATIDSYPVFFILLSYLFMLYFMDDSARGNFRLRNLFWCGLFWGISCATKWIGIYAGMGLAIFWLYTIIRYRPKDWIRITLYSVLFFVIIPLTIYILSYLPQIRYDLNGRTWIKYIIDLQDYMLSYHSGLTDTHPFSSPWYYWIIMYKPLWAFAEYGLQNTGKAASVIIMGNPIVWWSASIAMLALIATSIKKFFEKIIFGKREKESGETSNAPLKIAPFFIIIAFASQFVPWIFISRIVFIYHFFASVPFIIIALCYWFQKLQIKNLPWITLGLSALLFCLFFPVISGNASTVQYLQNLEWFRSWYLFQN
ncbi:MAG: phospholipid carrier-dependent glycosyltransferase [Clostridiales bacterium]|jgi:dolichyl-phosphate-mannose--protein O-mannosyl transferase|nr:phospholipid carrier-dependent glycosyltransferase [Clostridiales bacterium]